MTGEQVKQECEALYRQIKNAETRLAAVRLTCMHGSTFIGNFSYRGGAIHEAELCSFCNSVIKINNPVVSISTTT